MQLLTQTGPCLNVLEKLSLPSVLIHSPAEETDNYGFHAILREMQKYVKKILWKLNWIQIKKQKKTFLCLPRVKKKMSIWPDPLRNFPYSWTVCLHKDFFLLHLCSLVYLETWYWGMPSPMNIALHCIAPTCTPYFPALRQGRRSDMFQTWKYDLPQLSSCVMWRCQHGRINWNILSRVNISKHHPLADMNKLGLASTMPYP